MLLRIVTEILQIVALSSRSRSSSDGGGEGAEEVVRGQGI